EAAVAQVPVQQLALRITGFSFELLDLGIDMAVADQDVRPAVVIHVEESAAPAKILRVRSKAGGKGGVLETGIAEIAIERGRVAREIALHDVEIAVHVVIGRRDSHACLRLAVGAESASRFERD